jgi:thiamine biosynthesis protein ThiS
MILTLNGERRETPSLETISELLAHLDLTEKQVLVEQNGFAIARDHFVATTINDGDTFEIVRMVAGG